MRQPDGKIGWLMERVLVKKSAVAISLFFSCFTACGKPADTSVIDSEELESGESGHVDVEQYNVVLILTDTFRADHIGAYGYSRDTTPWFDTFAQDAVLFERATSQNAWTPASVSSLFTGLYTRSHGVITYIPFEATEGSVLKEEHVTIAELFSEAGYTTAALIKSPVPQVVSGYSQGFDSFEKVPGREAYEESGGDLADAAISWLSENLSSEKPSFLYLHFMEPHAPYIAPQPYHDQFDEGWDSDLQGTHAEVMAFRNGSAVATADDIGHLLSLYDGEIAYWDSQVQRIVEHIDSLGMSDDTIIAFVGDHGEQFNDHGDWLHGALYQENIHVPLVVRVPGVEGARISEPVQMMDLGPTLAELCGVGAVDYWQARSLAAVFNGGSVPGEPIFYEYGTERGVRTAGGMKMLFEDGVYRLFDLNNDPGELVDLGEVPAYETVLTELKEIERTIFAESDEIAETLFGE